MYVNENFSVQRGKHKNVSLPPCSPSSFATIAYSVNPEDAYMWTNTRPLSLPLSPCPLNFLAQMIVC